MIIPNLVVKQKSYHVDLNQLKNPIRTRNWLGKMVKKVTIGEGDHTVTVRYNDVLKNIAKEMKPEEAIAIFTTLKVNNNKRPPLNSPDGIARRKLMNKVIEQKYGGQKALFKDPLKMYEALDREKYDTRLLSAKELKTQKALLKEATPSHRATQFLSKQLKDSLSGLDMKNMKEVHITVENLGDKKRINFNLDAKNPLLSEKYIYRRFEQKCSKNLKNLEGKEELLVWSVKLVDKDRKKYIAINGIKVKDQSIRGHTSHCTEITGAGEGKELVQNMTNDLKKFFKA